MHLPDIIEWARSLDLNARPWLMLGKGPSFQRIREVDHERYFLCSLNHVVREMPVKVAHIIDLDVVAACADVLERNAEFLIMPWHPHVRCDASARSLAEFASEVPVLQRLADQGRLVWYNASTAPEHRDGSPVIQVKFFSAEAALGILATCGARVVRSLGVDGGNNYAEAFRDLAGVTLLVNRQDTFDKQFAGMARTIRQTGVLYAPLHIEAPIRIFVGTDAAQTLAVKVLEYSIKRAASMSVHVEAIDDRQVPVPRDPANRSRSGFSFSRFLIPQLCGHRGRGIYMDADMLVFSDVRQLWTADFEGAEVLYAEGPRNSSRPPQFSVLLLDCERLGWDVREIVRGLDDGRYDYRQLMQELCIVPEQKRRAGLPFEWNSLEHYEQGRTCLLHYTDMPTQPWVSNDNPNGELFYACCRQALEEGFIPPDLIYDEVEQGHVSPEFPGWVGLAPPRDLPHRWQRWKPPFMRFTKRRTATLGDRIRNAFARILH
jgi:hypothetical protein